ncbi:MAG TPA: MFS transporter [Candidatus Acidoferrum sp.]|nr:MFS transporter [Candidatus Acidoferrum sp.]
MFQPYLDFLDRPGVTRLFALAALTRMPISMVVLSLTLFLRSTLGNFTEAGLGVGAFSVSIAAMAPLLGRMIDRYGPRRPLRIVGWLQPLMMLGVYAAAHWQAPFAVILLLVILAGASTPPLATLTRTLWRLLFITDADRRMAFSLDSVITELNFTLGPAVVGVLAAAVSADVAFVTALSCNFLAVLAFQYSTVLDHWRHDHADAERHWLGPLSDTRLVTYFALTFGLTFCLGLFEVGYPAYALAIGAPVYAGLLVALNGIGSAIGGALYGVWQSRRSVEQHYALALTFLTLPFVLHALLPQLHFFIVVAFIGGLAVAPTLTSINLLVARRAPALYATEAQTWSATFIVSGFGGGMGAAGWLLETWSLTTMFWLGAAIVASMAACAWLLQRGTHQPGTAA